MSIVNFETEQPMDTLVHIALYRHPNGDYRLSVIDASENFLNEFETIKERQEAMEKFVEEATWVRPDKEN